MPRRARVVIEGASDHGMIGPIFVTGGVHVRTPSSRCRTPGFRCGVLEMPVDTGSSLGGLAPPGAGMAVAPSGHGRSC